MKKVEFQGLVYGYHCPISELSPKKGTEWFGDARDAIQASRMNQDKGKTFKNHRHIMRPRLNNYTQEAWVIWSGSIKIDIFNEDKQYLDSLEGHPGDLIVINRGYHFLQITDDNTVVYEVKNGEFTTVLEDKEYFD